MELHGANTQATDEASGEKCGNITRCLGTAFVVYLCSV